MKKFFYSLIAITLLSIGVAKADTLSDVKSQGFVKCAVSQGLPGFSNLDDNGKWTGIDVEFCRAVAAAIFNNPSKVRYVPTSAKERFTVLSSGEVQILSRNTTWTATRDTQLGIIFSVVTYYDGQGFMVLKSSGIKSAYELNGASICTNTGTTTELNAADFFRGNNLKYELVAFEKADEVVNAYDEGRCDAYTTDQSGLYAQRLKLNNPDDHIILPEIISKEPLGPVVRQGDQLWLNIVKWTHFAMLNAEELGITSENIDSMKNSSNPAIKRLVGASGNYGKGLGLGANWSYNIIKKVGNYSEVFERTVGPNTPLAISRGKNALWSKGGLQYGAPVR